MSTISSQRVINYKKWWLLPAFLLPAFMVLLVICGWTPDVNKMLASIQALSGSHGQQAVESHDEHDHAGEEDADHASLESGHAKETKTEVPGADDHDHEAEGGSGQAHSETTSLILSKQARANIGLQVTCVELRQFERTITVPGMIIERPGWSTLEITAPMTGVVTRIYPIQGEAVKAGQPLFEIRLTHEDLLQLQTEFLRTVEELDVVQQEVNRLEKITADGAVAGKTLLDRKYEQQKQQAMLRSQRQSLILHGLTAGQIDNIVSERTLLQSVTISVPKPESASSGDRSKQWLQVQELKAARGKYVSAGDVLCVLVNHGELYIEGKAFEQDSEAVNQAAASGWKISAVRESNCTEGCAAEGLKILYSDGRIDPESRAFHFYLTLPNQVMRCYQTPDKREFISWQYKPGQRMTLRIPVELWKDRIVLPLEAVAQDGAEYYVFLDDGEDFQRRPVHVEYRDQQWVVIANDGSIAVGDQVAASAAHQLQMAMKNKMGGGVDPHAGHNH
jgi:membrane fusion protein, heavy metal efflux system